MKGIVFTEFLEMIEDVYSPEVADQVILRAGSATDGAYTSVGTYDHRELVRMLAALSDITAVPGPELLRAFGAHLAGRFAVSYRGFFDAAPTLLDLLASIDSHIHVEVLKLYPDAELPRFEVVSRDAHRIGLVYRSGRHMHDLALGLIEGAAAWYGTPVDVEMSPAADGVLLMVTCHDHTAQPVRA